MISKAGLRRKQVTIERHNGNLVQGVPTYRHDPDWEVLFKGLPAAYRDVTGGETIRGRQMEANTNGILQIPSTPRTRGISAKMRIKFDGRTMYVVNKLDSDGLGRELTIQVSEVTP